MAGGGAAAAAAAVVAAAAAAAAAAVAAATSRCRRWCRVETATVLFLQHSHVCNKLFSRPCTRHVPVPADREATRVPPRSSGFSFYRGLCSCALLAPHVLHSAPEGTCVPQYATTHSLVGRGTEERGNTSRPRRNKNKNKIKY